MGNESMAMGDLDRSTPTSTAKKPTARSIDAACMTGGSWPGGRAAGGGLDSRSGLTRDGLRYAPASPGATQAERISSRSRVAAGLEGRRLAHRPPVK
jgi:hypothetical protein